ncbi:MAG: winged helix DNA-binding domain-containing protein, partial [Actinomycetales bacterium]
LAVACLGSSLAVAKDERRKLLKMLALNDVADPEGHLARAEAEALQVFAEHESVTTALLAEVSPLLATRLMNGPPTDKWATEVSYASRILLVLSSSGQVVRGRPRGGWTSTQFAWSLSERWHPALAERPDLPTAARTLAEAWLRRYGPATLEDLQWWTGWTKTLTRQAVADLPLTDVDLQGAPGVVLADDLEPVPAPEPWVALLPALDPTIMGWKHRDHLHAAHKPQVFDVNGNAGPTVWADGRVVGGWAQRDDGEVVTHLLEDVGSETAAAVQVRAAHLTQLLGDVRLKARARGWTPVEKLLRA